MAAVLLRRDAPPTAIERVRYEVLTYGTTTVRLLGLYARQCPRVSTLVKASKLRVLARAAYAARPLRSGSLYGTDGPVTARISDAPALGSRHNDRASFLCATNVGPIIAGRWYAGVDEAQERLRR